MFMLIYQSSDQKMFNYDNLSITISYAKTNNNIKMLRLISKKFNECITENITFNFVTTHVPEKIPKHIVRLKLCDNFDGSVDNLLNNITHLIFGHDFNQSVDNLPNSVTHLTYVILINQLIAYQIA